MFNSIDAFNGYMNNHKLYAKKQAEIDAIYENERRKYGLSDNSNTIVTHEYSYSNDEVSRRLDRIESRIDKLYEIIGNNESNESKLFVCLEGNVKCKKAISLTDDQFKMLIEKIKEY